MCFVCFSSTNLKSTPLLFSGAYFNFQTLAFISALFHSFIGLVVFLNLIKLIHLLRFNRRIGTLAATLKAAAGDMGTFSVVFFTVIVAYTAFAYFIFGRKLHTYRTFVTTLETLFSIMLGSFDYEITGSGGACSWTVYFSSRKLIYHVRPLN